MSSFTRLLDQIVDYSGRFPDLRNNLMSMMYRFLIEGLKVIPTSQSLAPKSQLEKDKGKEKEKEKTMASPVK